MDGCDGMDLWTGISVEHFSVLLSVSLHIYSCCQMCDVPSLVGKPKLFFIEACRGREHNMGRELLMTKSSAPLAPRTQGISLPNKQDVFVGFATVPGFVSFTSSLGSPYLQVCNILNEKYEMRECLCSGKCALDPPQGHGHVRHALAGQT